MVCRVSQVLVEGSYTSLVSTERCGRAGCSALSLDPGCSPAPPITNILPPTTAAAAAPRLVGAGASGFQLSALGSYSHALSMGCHAVGPFSGFTNPPKT